jgi:hypothetical protein
MVESNLLLDRITYIAHPAPGPAPDADVLFQRLVARLLDEGLRCEQCACDIVDILMDTTPHEILEQAIREVME